jgi:hypothetical protein
MTPILLSLLMLGKPGRAFTFARQHHWQLHENQPEMTGVIRSSLVNTFKGYIIKTKVSITTKDLEASNVYRPTFTALMRISQGTTTSKVISSSSVSKMFEIEIPTFPPEDICNYKLGSGCIQISSYCGTA